MTETKQIPSIIAAEMLSALHEVARFVNREYDTEYGGRMYTYCTSCEACLSEGDAHAELCSWSQIDAVILKANGAIS